MEARRGGLIGRNLGWIRLWLIAIVLLGALGSASPARAADAGLTIVQNTVQNNFPQSLTFNLQAQSTAPVSTLRLAYRLGDDPVTHIARVPVSPSSRISAQYTLDLQRDYLPPGIQIHYQWIVGNDASPLYTSDWSDLPIIDGRFRWQTKSRGAVTLHWYEGDAAFADAVLDAAVRAYRAASKDAGLATSPPSQVFLYANQDDFRGALSAGSDAWVGGQTFPRYHIVILIARANDLAGAQRSVAHEATHLAIDGGGNENLLAPLPTWLDEGMAMVAEGDTSPFFQRALDGAVKQGTLFSLQALSGNFPEDSDEATVAYAQSESVVRYLVKTYGRDRLAQLVAAYRRGETPNDAFLHSTGVPIATFEQEWRHSLAAGPGPNGQPAGRSLIGLVTAPITFAADVIRNLLESLGAPKTQPSVAR